MRRFRRRRAKPLWFPPLGSSLNIGDDTTRVGGVTFEIEVPNSGAIGFIEFPLTFDFGQERTLAFANNITPTESLATLMSSAWRLRRIVGDVFATYTPGGSGPNDPSGVTPPAALFAIGFMVRNVDETGLPVGSNVDVLNGDDYDDPWIWRRSWILGHGAGVTRHNVDIGGAATPVRNSLAFGSGQGPYNDQQFSFAQFPSTNVAYGFKDGGSKVDQKTNRLIGPEQRLMIHFGAKALPIAPQGYNGAPASFIRGVSEEDT